MKRFKIQHLCMMLLVVCLLAAGCSQTNGDGTGADNAKKNVVVENCVVKTKLYEFAYPEAMIDVIRIAESEGKFTGNLEFYAMMMDTEFKIFDMKYNDDNGDWTLTYETKNGKKIPISFVMYEIPDDLNESAKATFCAAHEVVNDVVATLRLK